MDVLQQLHVAVVHVLHHCPPGQAPSKYNLSSFPFRFILDFWSNSTMFDLWLGWKPDHRHSDAGIPRCVDNGASSVLPHQSLRQITYCSEFVFLYTGSSESLGGRSPRGT